MNSTDRIVVWIDGPDLSALFVYDDWGASIGRGSGGCRGHGNRECPTADASRSISSLNERSVVSFGAIIVNELRRPAPVSALTGAGRLSSFTIIAPKDTTERSFKLEMDLEASAVGHSRLP